MNKKEKTSKKKQKKKEELKICPQCGIHLSKKLKFCFHCDWVFMEEPKKKKSSKKKKVPE